MTFFTRMSVEQHPHFISSHVHSPMINQNSKEIAVFVPTCLFLLSKTASPIDLCSLLPLVIRVLAKNETEVTDQLLRFLIRDCIRPIPGVLGVNFLIGGESTKLFVAYGDMQLQNSTYPHHSQS